MTTEQQLRDQLDRATADVLGAPDVERSVQQGRRRRRTRRAGIALAAVAVVGIATGGLRAVTADDDGPTVARNVPVIAGVGAPDVDYVPGTYYDDQFAAVLAERMPALPAPDDVYPSDRNTAGPIPDADFAQADDWQAAYTVGDGRLLIMTSAPSEGGVQCPRCEKEQVSGGTIYLQSSSSDDGTWRFGVFLARPDDSAVVAIEYVTAPDQSAAEAARQFSDGELAAVIQDPRLAFTGSD